MKSKTTEVLKPPKQSKAKGKAKKVPPSDMDILLKNLSDFSRKYYGGYSSYIDYDTNYSYACQSRSSCCHNDYCRCGKIDSVTITKIDISGIALGLTDKIKSNINKYVIERAIVSMESNLLETNNWYPNIEGGYYGEELHGISCCIAGDVDKTVISAIDHDSDVDKIKNILVLEYGFLLPKLEDLSKAEVIKVKLSDVLIPNEEYTKKINLSVVDRYKEHKFPRAVLIKENDKLKLIDGYHRVFSAKKFGIDTFEAVILSK